MAGLIVGQIFAEGELPFTVVNTLRFGFDDNVDIKSKSNNPESSTYIEDLVELSFQATLSGRTDLVFKSRFRYRKDLNSDDDDGSENDFYPNLYTVLTHSVSPRLWVQLSDTYTSGNKTSSSSPASGGYDYFENTFSFKPSYALSHKDRLSAPISYMIRRNDQKLEDEDADIISAGLTWRRTLSPQRTWAALNLTQSATEYNRDSTKDSTRITAEISHTFNPEWHGRLEGGFSLDQRDFVRTGTNETTSGMHPIFEAGLTYNPSPRTRLSADLSRKYTDSNGTASYVGETVSQLKLGAQHDFTAKIMGKVTALYRNKEREAQDHERGGAATNEERFNLNFLLRYKVNRLNFIDMNLRHSQKAYDDSDNNWDQNMFDIGWRVEL